MDRDLCLESARSTLARMKIHARSTSLVLSALLATACRSNAVAPTPGANGFEGSLHAWRTDSTGGVGPAATWSVHADDHALSAPNVLALTSANHSSEERFNLHWSETPRLADVKLSVALRADGGSLDQGGGPVWRVQGPNDYYVCRYNPLEANFRVYVVQGGQRRQLGTMLVDGAPEGWHRIRVEHVGAHIRCWLDGHAPLDVTDATITSAGGTGVWTKADARTSFDDWSVSAP